MILRSFFRAFKAELAKQRAAEEERLKAQEYADKIQRIKQMSAKHDNELMDRYEQLSMLDTPGGVIAIIHKLYDYYLSEWVYSLSEDGQLSRHRDQDGATVIFESMSQLLDDFDRYRHCGFELYVAPNLPRIHDTGLAVV